MRIITKPTTVYKVPVADLMQGRHPSLPTLPVEIHFPQDCRPMAVFDDGFPDEEYADIDELLSAHSIVSPTEYAWDLMRTWETYQTTTDIEVES